MSEQEKEVQLGEAIKKHIDKGINNTIRKILASLLILSIPVVTAFVSHENRISKNEKAVEFVVPAMENLLDETGVEFVARRVADEKAKELRLDYNAKLDKKLDADVGDIILKSLNRIENKVDKIEKK